MSIEASIKSFVRTALRMPDRTHCLRRMVGRFLLYLGSILDAWCAMQTIRGGLNGSVEQLDKVGFASSPLVIYLVPYLTIAHYRHIVLQNTCMIHGAEKKKLLHGFNCSRLCGRQFTLVM